MGNFMLINQRQQSAGIAFALTLSLVLVACQGPSNPADDSAFGGLGVLMGTVTIGPMCPVERDDVVCVTPPQAYALRKLVVIKGAESKQVDVTSEGRYAVSLAPGEYRVEIKGIGMDRSPQLPRIVRIEAGATVVLNIDIDTGLR